VVVAVPAVKAVTSPIPLTFATAGADDAHVTVAVKALLLWSFGTAES
jgi:hypothetical protein